MKRPRIGLAAIVSAGAIGLLAGCGDDGNDTAETRTVTVAAGESPGTSQEAPPAPSESEAPDDGLASGEGGASGTRFRFVLTDLKRSGPTVVLSARVELLGEGSFQLTDTFGDGEIQKVTGGESTDEGGDVFDGVALIDAPGKKKYLVARDDTGRCVCSNGLSDTFAKPGAPVTLQATLTAPPESVKQVDVAVPAVEGFTRVAIQD